MLGVLGLKSMACGSGVGGDVDETTAFFEQQMNCNMRYLPHNPQLVAPKHFETGEPDYEPPAFL